MQLPAQQSAQSQLLGPASPLLPAWNGQWDLTQRIHTKLPWQKLHRECSLRSMRHHPRPLLSLSRSRFRASSRNMQYHISNLHKVSCWAQCHRPYSRCCQRGKASETKPRESTPSNGNCEICSSTAHCAPCVTIRGRCWAYWAASAGRRASNEGVHEEEVGPHSETSSDVTSSTSSSNTSSDMKSSPGSDDYTRDYNKYNY